jgi:hypothetical protein
MYATSQPPKNVWRSCSKEGKAVRVRKRFNVDEAEVTDRIKSAIGKPVRYKYPPGESPRFGVLEDRAVLRSNAAYLNEVPYWDVVDLIEFGREKWLRVGYYRMPKQGKLHWASQTTLTDRIGTWEKLLVHAAREKPWFREMLERVMATV